MNNLIIFRYIFRQLFIALFAFLFVLVGIAWITQILRLISFMVSSRISVPSFLYFTILLMPTILTVILPIAVFSVILYVYNKLIIDKEIIVMQSNGMNIKFLIKPAIVFMIAVTIFSYYLVIYLSPAFYLKFRDYKFKLTNSAIAMFIKYGEFTEVSKGLTLYVKESKKDLFLDIFINDARKPHNPRTIMAAQGQLIDTTDSAVITLVNGSIQEKNGNNYVFGTFDSYTVNMGITRAKSTPSYKPKDLFINQLFFAKSLGFANDKNLHEYKLEIHRRFITPLYVIIFGLIALIAMLRTSLNRRSNSITTIVSIACMASIQIFYIYLFDVLVKNNYLLWPIIYAFTFFIIVLLFYVLLSDTPGIKIIKIHRNKNKSKKSFDKNINIKQLLIIFMFTYSILSTKYLYAQFEKPKFNNDHKSISFNNKIDSAIFETNEIIYDSNTGIATTVGEVRSISPDKKSYFYANNMLYNVPENLIMVPGDVILNKDNNIITTKDIVMTADFKQIQAGQTIIQLSDGSTIQSESMVREDDNVHTLKNTTYTACPIYLKLNNTFSKCDHSDEAINTILSLDSNILKNKNLKQTPTWEIYSYKINQNIENKTISYKHAIVYMWGIPVLYVPYLIHPDPTIKRSSGLLFPKIGTSTATGTSITLPIYIYTDPYSFLTLSPMFNSKNKHLLLLDYKHNLKYFDIDFKGHSNMSSPSKEGKLLYSDLNSNMIFSKRFRGSLKVNRVSHDTYLRQYNFSNIAYLRSNMSIDGFWERSRLNINGTMYQDLRAQDSNSLVNDITNIYPIINYYGRTEGDSLGGFWALNLNTTTMYKQKNHNTKRYKNTRVTGSILRQNNNTLLNGIVLETALFARQDYYNLQNSFIYNPIQNRYDYLTDSILTRSHLAASIMASYPVYRNSILGMETFEPIVQFVASPYMKHNWKIENLDSINMELTDNNLFSLNRYTGYDLIETGNRINYAIKWGTYYSENNVSFMIGQSYSLSNNKDYPSYSGLLSDSGFSDIIGRVTYSHKLFKLSYHTRLDNESSRFNKNEFLLSTDIYKINLYVDYLFLKDTHEATLTNYEELYYTISAKLTNQWSAYFNNRYNFSINNILSYGLGARYQNDCFSFSVEMERKYSYDRDYKGDKSIFFTFAFKNLGSFETRHSLNTNKNEENR